MNYNLFGTTSVIKISTVTKKQLQDENIYDITTPYYYPLLNNKILYNSRIFNSYIKTVEETFFTLHSFDNKLTITKDFIQENILYTFKIIKETSDCRIVTVYEFDEKENVGFITKANIKIKKEKQKKKEKIIYKILINGKENEFIPIRHYKNGEEITVILCQKENSKIVFKELFHDNSALSVKVVKDEDKYYVCQGEFIKGFLFKRDLNREVKLNDHLKVYIMKQSVFKFVFTLDEKKISRNEVVLFYKKVDKKIENNVQNTLFNLNTSKMIGHAKRKNFENENVFDLIEGGVEFAKIKNVHPVHGTFVIVKGFIGLMKKSETSINYVENIENHLLGKEKVMGVVYNVNREERTFSFSVKKYEEMKLENKENEPECQKGKGVKRAKIEKTNQDEQTSITEKNNLFENILKSKLEITTEVEENIEEFKRYLETKLINDQKYLKESFFTFYMQLLDYLKENKYDKLKKICKTEESYNILTNCRLEKDLKQKILKNYYNTFKNEASFKKYLKFLLQNDIEDKSIYDDKENIKYVVDLIYQFKKNEARVRIEKILFTTNNIHMFYDYIKNEQDNVEYCRGLYRRVVQLNWNINQCKEWYKKWLEFEKKNNGDEEEVKQNARDYVTNLKK